MYRIYLEKVLFDPFYIYTWQETRFFGVADFLAADQPDELILSDALSESRQMSSWQLSAWS